MNQTASSDVPSETVQRIISAADQLYEENGRVSFPNVDAVRRRARVNMNDASAVMRIWRRTQSAAATPLTASIPEIVQKACHAMLATVWATATDSANSSLQMAQAGWEQERSESEACRQQLASAFDAQTEELTRALEQADTLIRRIAALEAELSAKLAETDELEKRAVEAAGRATTAEARADELTKRIDDLRSELARAHQRVDHERQESKHRLETMESTMSSLRDEMRHRSAIESNLREELARLRAHADVSAAGQQANQPGHDVVRAGPVKRTSASPAKQPNGTKS